MTDISTQEWRDDVFLRYRIQPPDMPRHYDIYSDGLFIAHAIECKKGGLVISCHNNQRDGVIDLERNSVTPTHVHDNPRSRRANQEGLSKRVPPTQQLSGDSG